MTRRNGTRVRIGTAVAALLLPTLLAAQQAAPPLPDRLRALDESLVQEHEELLRRVAPAMRDQGRFVAAIKAQQAAWMQYRDTTCAWAGMLETGSSAVTTRTLQCKVEWSEVQRMRLWKALDCIGQDDPAERAVELDRCLPSLVSTYRP